MTLQKKVILGIDPGIADTGFGVIVKEKNKLKYVTCGSIKTKKSLEFSTRLDKIYKNVKELITKYKPDIVGVEKLYFAKNAKTALDVGQARGVILLAIKQKKKPIVEFTPLQVKQAIASHGTASKQQVGLMVKTLLQLSAVPKPDDAADALAIAIITSFYNKKLS